jgi:hypothetical protein
MALFLYYNLVQIEINLYHCFQKLQYILNLNLLKYLNHLLSKYLQHGLNIHNFLFLKTLYTLLDTHFYDDSTLLNSKIFSWLEYANSRVHDTTKKKPIDMFKDEKPLLQPFYSSVKEIKDNKETKIINSSIDLSKLNMDIKYHTTISDYEKVLGVSYVGA